jgi:oligo-alginate lyase
LPYWYQGQITNTPFKIQANTKKLEPLGRDFGYQHIWLNAIGNSETGNASVTVLNNQRFYTTTFLTDSSTRVKFVTLGANDPNFNLRNEKAFIVSQPKAKNCLFISLVESHGNTNPIAETTVGYKGKVQSLKLLIDNDEISSFQFVLENKTYTVIINYNNKQTFITIK